MSEINLWSDDWEDWEDEDGCYNGTLFDFTFQKKLYLQVHRGGGGGLSGRGSKAASINNSIILI